MFSEMPRYVGFPSQLWCESPFAFKTFERQFKNRVPFFVSPFQYKNKDTPIIDNLLFDIDSYMGSRTPYRNVRVLRDFLRDHNIPYLINFSGGKGWHVFAFFKPVIPTSDISKATLADLMYSIQCRLAKDLKLDDFDEPTFGRTRFLIRYPTSLYLRKSDDTSHYEKSGFYCRNLTDEEFDSGLKHIVEIVKTPGIVPKTPKYTMTIQEIASIFPKFTIKHRSEPIKRIDIKRNGNEVPTIAALGLPCLQELCKHSHPTHYERVELVAFLKTLGYTDMSIIMFIKNCNWTRYSYKTTSYQIKTIRARMVRCSFLRKSYGNLCDKCALKKC